jgi:hypothetical protein
MNPDTQSPNPRKYKKGQRQQQMNSEEDDRFIKMTAINYEIQGENEILIDQEDLGGASEAYTQKINRRGTGSVGALPQNRISKHSFQKQL